MHTARAAWKPPGEQAKSGFGASNPTQARSVGAPHLRHQQLGEVGTSVPAAGMGAVCPE